MSEKALHHIVKNLVAQYGAEIVGDHRLKGLLADELGESFKNEASFEQAYKMGVGKRLLALRQSGGDVSLKLDSIKQSFAERSLLERPISDYVVDCMAYGLGLVKTVSEPSLDATTAGMTRKITQLNAIIAKKTTSELRARKIRLVGILSFVLSAALLAVAVNVNLMDTGRVPKSPALKNKRLMEAAAAGDAGYVSELLCAGASLDASDSLNRNVLDIALDLDNVALVDTLRIYDDYNIVDLYDRALGFNAVRVAGHLKSERDRVVNTEELFKAVLNSHNSRADQLVDDGADIRAKDYNGETLLFAAARGNNLTWVKKLLDLGVSVHEKNREGRRAYDVADNKASTYLYHFANKDELFVNAVRINRRDSARYFLDLGADINYVDVKNHYTAAHYAVYYNNVRALDTLKAWGANLNIATSQGTPVELAINQNRRQAFRYLISNLPGLAVLTFSGDETLLHKAIRNSNRDIWVPLLLFAGSDIYRKNSSGDLPIHMAAQFGDSTLVKMFVDRGCDPKVKNDSGEEVIKIAERYDNKNVERYLSQYYFTRRIKNVYDSVSGFISGILG